MAIGLNINTDAVVAYSKRLENLNRSALPVAIRQTLNDAAFDVKQNTLQQTANKHFIRRSPTFFKVFTGVYRAEGFNIGSMKAWVGMTPLSNGKAVTAVEHMEQQEFGGVIKDGADYLKGARGGSNAKRVIQRNYFDKNKNVKLGNFKRATTAKSQFVAAAYVSLNQKKPVSVLTAKGRFLEQVTSIKKLKDGRIKVWAKLLIKDRGFKPVTIRATHFSREAAMLTQPKMVGFYINQAQKQFERALKQ